MVTQGDWRLNQAIWIVDRIPGFFHHWRYDPGSKTTMGVVCWEGSGWAPVPATWLTERKVET